LLKTDVEGAEWQALQLSSEDSLSNIKILTGEFHFFSQLDNPEFFQLVMTVLQKIRKHLYPKEFTTQWMWNDNHERPHMALGGITPYQRRAMTA
jgi:hypothetical protein